MNVWQRLKTWFEWSGLTQEQVGERLGITQSAVSQLLREEIDQPSGQTMVAIHRVMGEPRADGEIWDGVPVRPDEWPTKPPRKLKRKSGAAHAPQGAEPPEPADSTVITGKDHVDNHPGLAPKGNAA